MGLVLVDAVTSFKRRVRRFYYRVVLLARPCLACGSSLTMQRDDLAVCSACGNSFDPTIEFQRCASCRGRLRRNRSRYECSRCGAHAQSQFAFDPAVFDRAYFARRMRESRERKRERKSQRHERLILARSRRIVSCEKPSLDDVPGLSDALDEMAGLPLPEELVRRFMQDPELDLDHYERHILENMGIEAAFFDHIPPLLDDRRRDRIFRFVACVFMCHRGRVKLLQQNDALVIERHEPD
jgi:predicted RNA-binding Zn-ribbon protein involved in translation (DUF1610 family)